VRARPSGRAIDACGGYGLRAACGAAVSDETPRTAPPRIPDVQDEAGETPPWVPWLGLGLLVFLTLLLGLQSAFGGGDAEEPAGDPDRVADLGADGEDDDPGATPEADGAAEGAGHPDPTAPPAPEE